MFLGLDLGTTNVKALVVSESGESLGEGSSSIQLFHVVQGGVEQDIEDIWAATVSAIRQATTGVNAKEIRAIGISSQGGALQVLDEGGTPVGRVISWLDQRGRPFDRELTEELGHDWFEKRVGHRGSGLAVGQLLRIAGARKTVPPHPGPLPRERERRPSQVLKTALQPGIRAGFVGDLIVGRLCGRGAQDGTSAALTLLYNPTLRSYDPELLQRLGIQAKQLPDLISPKVAAGRLLQDVAQATGLPAGIPVSPAIHDQYAAALGTGAVRPATTMLGAGTAWVLLAVSDRRMAPVADSAFVCHYLAEQGAGNSERAEGRGENLGAPASSPAKSRELAGEDAGAPRGLYGQIVSLVNGGSALTWALELMGLGNCTNSEIERLLSSAPAGSNGVLFWPFMARVGGEGVAPTTKGRLSGLQLSHKPQHVARAVVEGLAFELKRHLQLLERGGVPVERLVMGGGTAASPITTQIITDVTGLPLSCLGKAAGSTLGAAILARGLMETGKSLVELSREMLPSASRVEPGAEADLYAERFGQYERELAS